MEVGSANHCNTNLSKNKAGLNSQPHLTSLTRASPTGPVSKKMLDC